MKRFVAAINGGQDINIPADRMELTNDETALLVYAGQNLVGVVNLASMMEAHMSETVSGNKMPLGEERR